MSSILSTHWYNLGVKILSFGLLMSNTGKAAIQPNFGTPVMAEHERRTEAQVMVVASDKILES